jgi:hypothetical protein
VSAVSVRNPLMRSWIGHNLDEVWPGAIKLPEALRKWGHGPEEDGQPEHNGCALAFADRVGNKPFWEFLASDADETRGLQAGWRAKRFGEAMTCVTSDESFDLSSVHDMFKWDDLPAGSIMVDVSIKFSPFSLCLPYEFVKVMPKIN